MKQLFDILFFLFIPFGLSAQTTTPADTITLSGVTINAERVINNHDGITVLPTANQKENSPDVFTLLHKVSLPDIKVSIPQKTVSAIGETGDVQLRINGKKANMNDLLQLSPTDINSIDYIRRPGVRYGSEIAKVINLKTKQAISGYAVNGELGQTLKFGSTNGSIGYAKNFGINEIAINYYGMYMNSFGNRNQTTAEYTLADGTIYKRQQKDIASQMNYHSHDIQLKYSRAEADNYQFQLALLGSIYRNPTSENIFGIVNDNCTQMGNMNKSSNNTSPAANIFFEKSMGSHQSFTADITTTLLKSDYKYLNKESAIYSYGGNGKAYSLWTDLVYENKLRPFTFSSGLQYRQKYVDNDYSGDVNTNVSERISDIYLFSQIHGNILGADYVVGAGISQYHHRQNDCAYTFWLFRPKASVNYNFGKSLSVGYDISVSHKPPRAENISQIEVRVNDMDINRGNPHLKTSKRIEHSFNVNYANSRLRNYFTALYRQNLRTNLADITRTDDGFVFSQSNQPKCNLLLVQNNMSYDIIPQKLTVNLTGMFNRCFNYGNTYRHFRSSFDGTASIDATLGKLYISLYADTGWHALEGENKINNHGCYYLYASYRMGSFTLSAGFQHWFDNKVTLDSPELISKYVHKQYCAYNQDYARLVNVSLRWSISHGRKFKTGNHKKIATDNESGILKP